MRKLTTFALLLTSTCTTAAFALTHARHGNTHATLRTSAHGRRSTHATVRHESVRIMDPDRATAIQTALIEKGYMAGEPTGTWDAASVAAMQKLQGDNGWQTKITPDSRALIKLGLGPQQTASAATP